MVPSSSGQSFTAMTSPQSPVAAAMSQRSPWHSPVPYLFGGLAAMLGLIAFALLILACSYWKLSGYLEDRENSGTGDRDLEMGEGKTDPDKEKIQSDNYEEKVLVILAGQLKPSCLATPIPSRASSFGSNVSVSSSSSSSSSSSGCSEKSDRSEEEEADELRIEASV